ncbi:hypothetical protein SAMD00019534_059040 [Acytostelium subglobosum LB1]|uniref:hypothetical protein n=1 Tax=Acytostelium subglobosum LB1 TaxID=1410327 RepID=UPI000644D853|nr:hypothetical protein SAMD00019534_059040 [Acytostelium subglobosum LB1]GAM22729.1 hypothetical protein SAMD00019534_059040 [Acytostelium subglobosum LB1]|eukprot:XP_012753956.1 hypothetical protein SAMD00019534_059040 [Acytostelium subglobosum LB1]
MASARVVNSTAGQAVLRGDGIRVFGLDAELELKAQSKRDPNFERELATWIEQATGMKLQYPNDLIESLRSGIVLCTLINVLIPDTIKKINTKPIPLMEVENIGLYLKACWKVGVPSSDLFVTSDLYQRKGVPAVLQNLASIGRAAHTCPAYKGPSFGAKPSALPPAKKWDEIKFNAPILITDLEERENITPRETNFCISCGTKKMCFKCDHVHPPAPVPVAAAKNDDVVNKQLQRDKDDLSSRIEKLSNMLKDQEEKVSSLNGKMDQQRRQHEQKERELSALVENQKIQIEQKQRQILTIEAQKSVSTNNTPITLPTIPKSPVATSTPAPSATAASAASAPTGICSKCNFQSSKTSKYCTKCGHELAKQVQTFVPAPVKTATLTTPPTITPANTNGGSVPASWTAATITQQQLESISQYRTVVKDKEELSNKILSMLASIKQQDDTINKLQKAMADERKEHDQRVKEQRAQLDSLQRQLEQKEKDINHLKSVTTPPRSASPPNVSSFGAKPPAVAGNLTAGDKRFTVQMNSGFRSNQIGPGSYTRDRADSLGNGTPVPSKVETTVWPPVTLGANRNDPSGSNRAEVERLQKMVERLEKSLQEESARSKVKGLNNKAAGGEDLLDNRLVEETHRCVHSILFSRPIEFQEVQSLNAIFKTEPGRRRFSQILQSTLKQVPNIVLSESSFEFLLYLISTTLQEMDLSTEHDIITAKVIMHASSSLYRVNNGNQQEYIKDFIRSSPVWRTVRFWEDYFWDQLAKRHRKRFDQNFDGVDKEIVSNLLSFFGVNMVHFSVPHEEIKSFLVDMAQSNGLSSSEVNVVLDILKTQTNDVNNITTPKSPRSPEAYVLSPGNKKEKKSRSFLRK